MERLDWSLQVEVEKLDSPGIDQLLWQLHGGHGAGVPIEGSIGLVRINEEGFFEAEGVELRGSGRGACSILDEFMLKLTPQCGVVRLRFRNVSKSAYQTLLESMPASADSQSITHHPPYLTVTLEGSEILQYRCEYALPFCSLLDSVDPI